MTLLRALVLVFLASPVLAEGGPTAAEREAFVDAITANGCKMTETEAEVQLPAVGIDRDTSDMIAEALMSEGLAKISADGQTLTLLTEGCVS